MKKLLLSFFALVGFLSAYAEDIKVYYVNSNNWTEVYAYVWNDMRVFKYWPGAEMTFERNLVCNKGAVYSYTFSKAYTNLIFNNDNGIQTTDMTVNTAKPYFYKGVWYASLSAVNAVVDQPKETVYYLIGEFNNWSLNTAIPFKKSGAGYTVSVKSLKGDFKVLTDRSWVTNYGAPTPEDGKALNNVLKQNQPFSMELSGENLSLGKGTFEDVKLSLKVFDEYTASLTYTAAVKQQPTHEEEEDIDYYLIGDFNEWELAKAVPFKPVRDTLSISLYNLAGTFKIIKGHAWTINFGAPENHTAVAPGTKLLLSKGGKNIAVDGRRSGLIKVQLIPGDQPVLIVR